MTFRCFLRDWLSFDDSEEKDDAKWEQNKEGEADDVKEEVGEQDEQPEEDNDGTIFARM